MQRDVGESNYVELSARYAARGLFNHSHFFVELGRLDPEGDDRTLTREHAAYIQQRSAAAQYFRNPRNLKDLNPLAWVGPGEVGYHKDYRNDGHDYDDYDDGGARGGITAR